MSTHRVFIMLVIVALSAILTGLALAQDQNTPEPDDSIQVRLDDGDVVTFVLSSDGSGQYVRAEQSQNNTGTLHRRWTGPMWLFVFGLVGQMMFMGRFALQWIASERAGKSVVPLGFWWLSVSGATILMTYFVLRQDPIGVLGQLLGWPIYVRNIYMVLRDRSAGTLSPTDPAKHPVPDPNAEA